MTKLTYMKHERVSLKDHPEFDERWLQDLINQDPSVLGLPGALEVLDRERRQERAGRLDLLLYDPDEERRFELELMLGSLDESHIIRAIEYWDLERRRYPGYDHVAVLVAEDVTGRFLNVLSLLAGTIPMIVLQCNALQVGGQLVLDFVKVLDQTSLRRDDEREARADPVTRDYWVDRVGEPILGICESSLAMINAKATTKMSINFLRQYIGLRDGTRSRNYVHWIPTKNCLHLKVSVGDAAAWVDRLEKVGIETRVSNNGMVRATVTPDSFTQHRTMLGELIAQAVAEFEA